MSSIADQAAQKPQVTMLDHGEQTLAFYAWPNAPENARAAILLLHGLGEHMGRYGHVASALQAAGYAVFGYDHHGHGLSSGLRGNLLSPSQLLDDARFVIEHVRSLSPAPMVLLGHSMGGLIAARAVANALPHIDALVMSSPALGAQTNIIQKLLLATLPKLFPHIRVDNGVKSVWVARDAKVVRAYVEDPLVHRQISAGLAAWILKEGTQTVAQASAWSMPTLLLYAGQDQLVLPQASAEFARLAPAQVVQSHCFNVMYHEIFNDPEKALVLTKLLAWLDNRYAL
jgi:alpha-beta hydrolase superfamily lysophospholipase